MSNHRDRATSSDARALLGSLLLTSIPPHNDEADALLRTLLATPLSADQQLKPAVLWRPDAQRQTVMQEIRQRDRLDSVLARAERTLLIVAIVALGAWALLVPGSGWLHDTYARPRLPGVAQQPTIALPTPMNQVVAATPPAYQATARPVNDPDRDALVPIEEEDFLVPSTMVGAKQVVALPAQPSHLLLPSIGVDTSVVEVFYIDDEWQVAQYAAGYLNGSGLPGEANNMVIAGHAGLFGGVFANLHKLAVNDDIYVDAAGWRYHYRVRDSLVVWPTETEYLFATDVPRLTLITCTNWDLQSIVVIADFVGAQPL